MVKLGIVGMGHWGPNILRNFILLKNSFVKTICDKKNDRLNHIKQQYSFLETTTDIDTILQDKDIDAVVIVTLSKDHYTLTKRCLEAGKHVFVEKPLALTIKEGEELVELSHRKNKVLMVGHLLLYHPAVRKMKELIDKGEIGNVRYIYSTRVNLGKIREDENALWSFGPHDISVILYLLEGRKPLVVQAQGGDYLRKGVEDVVFLNIRFTDKVLASVHLSWLDPHKIRKFTVVGDKRMLVFDDMEPSEKIRIYDKGVDYTPRFSSYPEFLSLRIGDVLIPKIDMKEPLLLECQHFLECIEKNLSPVSNGRNGIEVVKVLQTAQDSLRDKGTPKSTE